MTPAVELASQLLDIPTRVRNDLVSIGTPLVDEQGRAVTRGTVEYIGLQLWGWGGNSDYREFVSVQVRFPNDSTDKRTHYSNGFHTVTETNVEGVTGSDCTYKDYDPRDNAIRFNDAWVGDKLTDPNYGPACGSLESSSNQKVRENYVMPLGAVQVNTTVSTADDTMRIYYGTIKPLSQAADPSVPYTTFTFTQGGWGATPSGNNPGQILATYFNTVYPSGRVTIGGAKTLTFTSASAIQTFLPQGGSPVVLSNSYTNPTNSSLSVFAGQVLALQLNVDFSRVVFKPGLGDLKVKSGSFAGYTVNQVLTLANSVLGGGALPSGKSLSSLNDTVTKINEGFDNGTTNTGYCGN